MLEVFNLVFFGAFFFEMIIKLIGLGFKLYLKDRFNMFDMVIVIFSCVDTTLTYAGVGGGGGGAISAMRGFRLLRIFKLAQSWKKF